MALPSWRIFALALLLIGLAAPAHAGLRQDLATTARELQRFSLPAEPKPATAALEKAVDRLHWLAAQSQVFREHNPGDAWIGWMHLAEGIFGFSRGLLSGPCPKSLDKEQCAAYEGHLAGKAHIWLRQGLDAVSNAEAAGGFEAADARRLEALRSALSVKIVAAEAKMPKVDDGPWVAVRESAWFTTPDGQRARVTGIAEGAERAPVRLRWLGEEAGLVRVAVAPWSPDGVSHCVQAGPLDSAWGVELLVDAADVVLVSRKELRVEHPDGTKVFLTEGVPVDPSGRPTLSGISPATIVPELHRGRSWLSEGRAWTWQESAATVPASASLTVGSEPVEVRVHQDWIYPRSIEERADDTLLTFSTVCGEVTASHPGPLPAPPEGGGMVGGLLGALGGSPRIVFASGATLRWPDGTAAGELRTERTFDPSEVEVRDALSCGRVQLGYMHQPDGPPPDGAITLCVDHSDVARREPQDLEDLLGGDRVLVE